MKKKIILIRDIIFNKEKVYNKKPNIYYNNDINKINKAIKQIKVFKFKVKEIKDRQLSKKPEINI